MENRLLICESGCRTSEVQGPFRRFDGKAKCVYCGGMARAVTAEELETWRAHGDGIHQRRDMPGPAGGV